MFTQILSLVTHPVALVIGALAGAKQLKVPQKIWKEVSKDINAAGASVILQSTLFSISVFCFIQGRAERKRVRRIKAVDLSRECTWNPLNNKSDPAKFLRYVMGENLPQWVSLSDWDNAPFLQALLTTMWPGINNELSNLLRKILQSEASHILTINKLDLGKRPVTLYGVKVLPVKNKRDTTKIESLVVLLDLRWGGEPDVSITVKVPKTGGVVALNAGMRNLEFAGTVRIAIDGIQNQAPFLTSWRLSLINCPPPQLNYNLFLLENFLPGHGLDIKSPIEQIVPDLDKAIKKALFSPITWPNNIQLPVPNDDSKHGPLAVPLGILEVEMVNGDLIKRYGLFGRERLLNPRISLLLPCCDGDAVAAAADNARYAATQGGFTDAAIKTTQPKWNSTFKFVISSEDQMLRLVLSHKHSIKNDLEPMCYEKPLGSQIIPIRELIPKLSFNGEDGDTTGYYTAEESDTESDTPSRRDVGSQTDEFGGSYTSLFMARSWSASRHLDDDWQEREICLQSTDKPSLASLLEEVLPSSVDDSVEGSKTDDGSISWLQSKVAAMGEQAELWDWNRIQLDEVAGTVTIKYKWTPIPAQSDESKKDSNAGASSQLSDINSQLVINVGTSAPKKAASLASVEDSALEDTVEIGGGSCEIKSINTVQFGDMEGNKGGTSDENELIQHCLACGRCKGECIGADAVPPLPLVLSPSLDRQIKGVLGIFVERSKLHYDKLPRVPTLSIRIKRIVNIHDIRSRSRALINNNNFPERPQALPSQKSTRKNKGSLIWNQTFYLPVETTQRELDENAVRIYVELGDVGGGPLSAGWRRQMNCGKEIFVLDTYDTFDTDVSIVACSDIPLANVIKSKNHVLSDKHFLAAPSKNSLTCENGTVVVMSDKGTRSTSNIGSLKMRIAWFPL